jgi:hypothetical protein
MSNPNPGIVERPKQSSAALAVNPFNPACVSRMPGSRKVCTTRLKARLMRCRVYR